MAPIISYIALGSNLGTPTQHVEDAIIDIGNTNEITLIAQSSLYLSPPMTGSYGPDYINAVVKIETFLSPADLFQELQLIEQKHGRVKREKWGARTLDLDILLYGDQMIKTETLVIPHYGIADRDFVLLPLIEIEREIVLPDGRGAKDLLEQLPVIIAKRL